MKPFLDTGFLLTLLFKTAGSAAAWEITRNCDALYYTGLQRFTVENRLLRQIESRASAEPDRALAASALQRFQNYALEEVFIPAPVDYGVAVVLAGQWQQRLMGHTPPAMLLLWPALAATIGATHFLSFDPRTRQLARAAGLKLLPDRL